jgi:phage terminase small subunit
MIWGPQAVTPIRVVDMYHNAPTKTDNGSVWAADLSLRERRFVEEFIVDLNGRQAAIRAGLGKSAKSASEMASRMRKKPAVAAAISALMAERNGVTGAAVVSEIGALAFSRITDFLKLENGRLVLAVASLDDLPDKAKAAIAKIKERVDPGTGLITIEVELWDKISALDKLGKTLGIFRQRAEVAHTHEIEFIDPLARIKERLNALRRSQEAGPVVEIQPPVERIAPPQPRSEPPVIDAQAE